jgi:hypothetical protein
MHWTKNMKTGNTTWRCPECAPPDLPFRRGQQHTALAFSRVINLFITQNTGYHSQIILLSH